MGAETVNTAGIAFKNIANLVIQVSDQVKDISVTIHQMDRGSQEIVSSVKNINKLSQNAAGEAQNVSAATEEQSVSMEEIASSSQNLSHMAHELQDLIRKFRVKV